MVLLQHIHAENAEIVFRAVALTLAYKPSREYIENHHKHVQCRDSHVLLS